MIKGPTYDLGSRKTYTVDIFGVERVLPLEQVTPEIWIPNYDLLSEDTEVIERVTDCLFKELYIADCQAIVTAEADGISLGYSLSAKLGYKPLIVCRKGARPFMQNPLSVKYKPSNSPEPIDLVMDGLEARKINGKGVVLLDDAIITQETFNALRGLVRQAHAYVAEEFAILSHDFDVNYAALLPEFVNKN